jgi:hypothetical protein
MNAIWFAFLVAVAIVVLAETLRGLLPSVLAAAPTAAGLRRERAEKELEFSRRRQEAQDLVMQRNVLINDRTELETKLAQLEHRQRLLDLDRPLLVIELGEPRGDNKIYRAGVSNRFVVANRVPPGMFDTPINAMWSRENSVEVWARDVNEARALLETTYPKGKGFEIVFFGDQIEAAA